MQYPGIYNSQYCLGASLFYNVHRNFVVLIKAPMYGRFRMRGRGFTFVGSGYRLGASQEDCQQSSSMWGGTSFGNIGA